MDHVTRPSIRIACIARKQIMDALIAFVEEAEAGWIIEKTPDIPTLTRSAESRTADCIVYEVTPKDMDLRTYITFCDALPRERPPVVLITAARGYKTLRAEIMKAGIPDVLVAADKAENLFMVLESLLHGYQAAPLPPMQKRPSESQGVSGKGLPPHLQGQGYQFLLKTCRDAVIVFEAVLTGETMMLVREINRSACLWLGQSPAALYGSAFRNIFVFKNEKQTVNTLDGLLSNQTTTFTASMRGERGTLIPVEAVCDNFPSDRGTHFLIVTARRQDTALSSGEIRNTANDFTGLPVQSVITMYEGNLKTQAMIWGGEVEEITGFTSRELKQAGLRGWRERICPEDYHRVIIRINEAVRKLGKYHLEYRIVHKSGEIRHIEDHGVILPDESGTAERLLGTMGDITLRVQEQEQRLRLEQELQHSQRLESLGALAGGIAHDFNNILAGIIGLTDLALREVPANSFVNEDLKEVLQAANRAKELVRQILAFSRQSGQEKSPLYLHIIAREVIKFLRASLPPTIEIIDSADIHSGAIMANAAQMYQVITNFTTNAAHAMKDKPGKIEISVRDTDLSEKEVRNFPGLRPGPYVRLSVQDTGHGMSKSVLSRAFDPFFTTKGPGEGSGMGLAVVHGIVTDHGGMVTAQSRLGAGSIFDVLLPRISGVKIEETEKGKYVKGSGERLLFVDDDVAVLHFADMALPRLGFEVTLCMSGEEGLHVFMENTDLFDLVITDQIMPKMSGLDLAKKVHAVAPQVPILLFTGFSDIILPATLADHGIEEVVYKPIVMNDLVYAIQRAVDKSRHSTVK